MMLSFLNINDYFWNHPKDLILMEIIVFTYILMIIHPLTIFCSLDFSEVLLIGESNFRHSKRVRGDDWEIVASLKKLLYDSWVLFEG